MQFAVHDDEGRITQSNKVFSPEGYDRRLRDIGHKFVQSNHDSPISMDDWWVTSGNLTERQRMAVAVNKTTIKAGDNDCIVITGAPKNVKFSITVQDTPIWSGQLPDGELELSVPTPGLYRVALHLWPYRNYSIDIEAIA